MVCEGSIVTMCAWGITVMGFMASMVAIAVIGCTGSTEPASVTTEPNPRLLTLVNNIAILPYSIMTRMTLSS